MNDNLHGIYGRGWVFPPSFTVADGVAMAVDQDDIEQSMRILFMTQPGERIMREDYGCDLFGLMFEIVNDDLLANITTRVTESVLRYEQRVALEAVDVSQMEHQPGKVAVSILYRIRGAQAVRRLQGSADLSEGRAGLVVA